METIDLKYRAREPFVGFHTRKERFACIVAHRRAGKTVASTLDGIDHALRCTKKDGRYAYIAPYYAQAKDVVWNYVKQYTWQIPGIEANESELRVDFPNGSRFRLYGADNYDRMRGIYLDGAIMDEPADQPPQAWREVIRPALADRLGWATFIGTPKGKNAFYRIHREAQNNPDWFSLVLRASETGLIDPAELIAMRKDMSANEYDREMECNFEAAIEGAYFAEGITAARKEGRVGKVPINPNMVIHLFFDIGGTGAKSDNFVIWAAQFIGQAIHWVDHYEVQGQDVAAHLAWLRSRKYSPDRAKIWLPHDGATNDRVINVSYQSAFEDAGYTVEVVPNQGKGAASIRIDEARRLLPSMWFDEENCEAGIDALIAYHEKIDEKRGIGLGPEHDGASHSADAFGLGAICHQPPGNAKPWTFKPLGRP